MVQIGNYHIGRAESAEEATLGIAEAFFIWDQLISRYNIIEATQYWQNFAHDPDLKVI